MSELVKRVRMWIGRGESRKEYWVEDATENTGIVRARKAFMAGAVVGDCSNCALAKVLRKTYKNLVDVHVGKQFLYLVFSDRPDVAVRYVIPDKFREAIAFFDETGMMLPGDYYFLAPTGGQRLGERPKKSKEPSKTTAVRPPAKPRKPSTRRVNGKKLVEAA